MKKVVVGATTSPSAFSFAVSSGGGTHAFEADGQNQLTLPAGTYCVTEPAVSGWTTTYAGCSNVVLSLDAVERAHVHDHEHEAGGAAAAACAQPEAEREEGGGRCHDLAERLQLRGLQRGRDARLRGRRSEPADPARRHLLGHRARGQRLDDDLRRLLERRALRARSRPCPRARSRTRSRRRRRRRLPNPKLNVKKVVVGATTSPSAFSFAVSSGGGTHAFEADGQNQLTLPAGTYSVTEPAVSGWTTTYAGCSNVVLSSTQSTVPTCTITNTKQEAPAPPPRPTRS